MTNFLYSDACFGCVLWKYLCGVVNNSISSSIKKFSSLTRSEMEYLSETVDLKYLLGVMNSKYASILLNNIRGGDYHIYPQHIRKIPIPTATSEQQKAIIALVDQILAAKKKDPQADTTGLEAEIDRLVYALYGITDEKEIAVIEGRKAEGTRGDSPKAREARKRTSPDGRRETVFPRRRDDEDEMLE